MAGDWIKLHRKAVDSAVFTSASMWHLWCYLLMKANWKPSWYEMQKIDVGELVFGRNSAAETLGCSPSAVYRNMKKLEEHGMIKQESNNRWTRVSICNWRTYQILENDSEQRMNNGRTTDEQQADNKRTHPKKDKNYKEREEGKNNSSSEPDKQASEPAVMEFPVVASEVPWRLEQHEVDVWLDAFPGIDVLGECRKARAWLISNPSRMKTPRGMTKFLFSWLERSQNGVRSPGRSNAKSEQFSGLKAFLEQGHE